MFDFSAGDLRLGTAKSLGRDDIEESRIQGLGDQGCPAGFGSEA